MRDIYYHRHESNKCRRNDKQFKWGNYVALKYRNMCIDYVILSFACYIYYSVSITSIEFHHVIYQKVSTTKYQ